MSATKEQIEEAKKYLTSLHFDTDKPGKAIKTLVDALTAAEKERDKEEKECLKAIEEREQATELAKQLAEKVARAEGRAKLLEARVAELAKAGNPAIVELRKNESEYSYERYLRAVKNWDALIAKMEEGKDR